MRVLLSLSVFSFFLFFYSSSLLPIFVDYFDHQLYISLSTTFLSYSDDRNCIFLLCNGILVFLIIKNSGFMVMIGESQMAGSSDYKLFDPATKKSSIAQAQVIVQTEAIVVVQGSRQNEVLVMVDNSENYSTTRDENEELFTIEDEQGKEAEEEDDEEEEEKDDDDEKGVVPLSVEEFNKKCEDFIKRMREGIRMESQKVVMI